MRSEAWKSDGAWSTGNVAAVATDGGAFFLDDDADADDEATASASGEARIARRAPQRSVQSESMCPWAR